MSSPLARAVLDSFDDETVRELADRLLPDLLSRLERPHDLVFLTCREAADLVGLHVETVRRAVRSGELAATHLGNAVRITAADLKAWASSRSQSKGRRKTAGQRKTRCERTLSDAFADFESSA